MRFSTSTEEYESLTEKEIRKAVADYGLGII